MNYFLGVELNGNQIKIAATRKKGQVYDLVKLDSFILPPDSHETTKTLTAWVDRFLPEATNIKAVLTVSESALYLKEMEFPEMDSEKLQEAVYWEIPTVAPVPQSDAVFDWQIVGKNKNMQQVLIIVGKNSYVQSLITSFRNAQIDIIVIEPSSYAFARAANAPFDTNTLLYIAEEKGTNFIVLKNGIPYFTTSSTGNTQTAKVSQIKSGNDLSADIATEGKKIITYWETKEGLKINQVVVGGDLVYKYLGLSTALNLFPPIPSYIGTFKKTPTVNTGEYTQEELGSYLVALGAASRHQHKDVYDGINLFPASEKQKAQEDRAQKKAAANITTFIYANSAILLFLIISVVGANVWWYSLEKKYDTLNKTLSAKFANDIVSEVTKTNEAMKNVALLSKNQTDVGAKLKTISDLTPQSITLTSINLVRTKQEEWTIEGLGDRNSILVFYKKLTLESKASKVSMLYSNFEKPEGNEFGILITW